mmetsp:Transcript_4847/g.7378  ORF Transcript_4847/g.7378 Transcript_4847/m.7378 type:complete len:554 (-) Transcript_4847:25-1686(-)
MSSYWDLISKRWQIIILLHTGFIIEYTLRVNASVAVVQMKESFGWTEDQHGVMLSAFYWGYAVGQLPSAFIVQQCGAKPIFAWSILLASILTIILPVASEWSFSAGLIVRAFTGLAESAAFPATFHMYPSWVPEAEQTSMITCVMSGLYLGEILCFLISGYLVVSKFSLVGIEMGGWIAVFWVFGVVGLVWTPLWLYCAYDTPEEHPTITSEELELLSKGKRRTLDENTRPATPSHIRYTRANSTDEVESSEVELLGRESLRSDNMNCTADEEEEAGNKEEDEVHLLNSLDIESKYSSSSDINMLDNTDSLAESPSWLTTPWVAFFTHPTSVTLLIAYWTQNWIGYLILSELPTYFTEELGFNLKEAGLASMAPYIAQYVCTLAFGWGFQYMQKYAGWSTRAVRQTAQHVCFIGSSLCLVVCGFVSSAQWAMGLMVVALALYAACQSGLACAFLDVSPNYSSTLNTVANLFGALSGVASPIVVSLFTDAFEGVWGWRFVFLLTALQCVLSSILWYMYQTSDIVPLLNNPSNTKNIASVSSVVSTLSVTAKIDD